MTKALKELRNPAATIGSIRKAGRTHTKDFDAFIEAEIKVRQKLNATLTTKQSKQLQAIQLPDEEKMSD